MALPYFLSSENVDEAGALVREYYRKLYRNALPQTGSRFGDWAGGGDCGDVTNTITADNVPSLVRRIRQGPTTASKIMARKRPRLSPIYDSVVGPLMGLNTSDSQWRVWHTALTDGTSLPERLRTIPEISGVDPRISELRTMDVVLWMHGKKLGMTVEDAPESDE